MHYIVRPEQKSEYGFCNAAGCEQKHCNDYSVDVGDGVKITIVWIRKSK